MGAQAVRLSNIDIDNALKNRDFEVLFQPVFDLSSGVFARVEAFVRWRHRQLGVLPPGAFISYFESQGRMSELTRYVLDRALADYLAWRGPQGPGFSINLALSDLADEAFSSHLTVTLRDRGIAPSLITLECPMPPVTMEMEQAAAHFARLSETGVRLAIEVRGRANDFLKQIDPFPFDEIKTGGAAILRFARTVRGPGLSAISELLEIAKAARSSIIAVGVEDQASLSALKSLGFSAAQGNHLAPVGTLNELPSAKINDVRTLLGLPALEPEQIKAIAHPIPSAERPSRVRRSETDAEPAAATVDRLSQRIARQKGEPAPSEGTPRDRIKAALAAGRDKAALTKAAAIAKAKRKGEAQSGRSVAISGNADEHDQFENVAAPEPPAPARQLYDRLAEAFDMPGERVRADIGAAPARTPSQPSTPFDPGVEPPANETTETARRGDAVSPYESPRKEDPTQRPAESSVTLAIGPARAYFRPAVHVAADAWKSSDVDLREAAPRDTTGDLVEFRADALKKHVDLHDGGGFSTSRLTTPVAAPLREPPPVAPAVGAAAPEAETLLLDTPATEAHAPSELQPVSAPRPRARAKKVRYYYDLPIGRLYFPPKHFWPRPRKRRVARARPVVQAAE